MPVFVVWLLFVVKHGILAHLVDSGYSYCRDNTNRSWPLGLVLMITLEVTVTAGLLSFIHSPILVWVCMAEAVLAIVTCLIERRAAIVHMLQTHIKCELGMLIAYGFIAMLVWSM